MELGTVYKNSTLHLCLCTWQTKRGLPTNATAWCFFFLSVFENLDKTAAAAAHLKEKMNGHLKFWKKENVFAYIYCHFSTKHRQ